MVSTVPTSGSLTPDFLALSHVGLAQAYFTLGDWGCSSRTAGSHEPRRKHFNG